MQFYTKLGHAKIIIFLPCCIYMQCMFPCYFPDAVYFVVAGGYIVFHHSYHGKCYGPRYEFCSKCFLWHIAYK